MNIATAPPLHKRWYCVPPPHPDVLSRFAKQLNTAPALAAILLQRGIDSFDSARDFFNPSIEQLHNPLHMKDMQQAVHRLQQALHNQQHICIYGDYDVDGITSVALLYKALKHIGAHVSYYLPDRHKEGYGLSTVGIQHCHAHQVKLMIAIDCGIRAISPIQQATTLGIDVIVCDHHQPGPTLPNAIAILNPKQPDCPYPFKELSGCGIGFKLLQALAIHGLIQHKKPYDYLDLVAVSTAADIVPMVGENRILTALGLAKLKKSPTVGLAVLNNLIKPNNPHTVSGIVFGIAPPINAVGRLSHPKHGLQLLLAKDQHQAQTCAQLLLDENTKRKELDRSLFQEALIMIDKQNKASQASLVLFDPSWHKGILGIVAARCVEHHYKPTIILTQQGNTATGSARSVLGYNIYEALQQCHHLLTNYGGHAYAAGLTLPLDNVATLSTQFESIVQQTITPDQRYPQQIIDVPIHLSQITHVFYNVIQRMRPFGPKFRQPVFCSQPVFVLHYQLYQDKHIALRIKQQGDPRTWRAIGFNMKHLLPYLKAIHLNPKTSPLAIAYTIQKKTYQGSIRYELFLKDFKPCPPPNPSQLS